MSPTITPTRCEISDGDKLYVVIEMQDENVSTVTVKGWHSPNTWRELAEAVQCALETMHPEAVK